MVLLPQAIHPLRIRLLDFTTRPNRKLVALQMEHFVLVFRFMPPHWTQIAIESLTSRSVSSQIPSSSSSVVDSLSRATQVGSSVTDSRDESFIVEPSCISVPTM